jgi:hypothetical protein
VITPKRSNVSRAPIVFQPTCLKVKLDVANKQNSLSLQPDLGGKARIKLGNVGAKTQWFVTWHKPGK